MQENLNKRSGARKPRVNIVMLDLISQIRERLPFNNNALSYCNGPCLGCSKKLMEYLESELLHWEVSIENGESPTLGDLNKLAKTAKKIASVLVNNGLLEKET